MTTPWIKTSGSPSPCEINAAPPRVLDRCGIGDVMAEFFEVLIAVADTVMRTAADQRAERDDDLVGRRCVRDRGLDGEVVRAPASAITFGRRSVRNLISPS